MNRYLLVINAGSSSIKFAVYRAEPNSTHPLAPIASGQIEAIGNQATFKVKDANGAALVDIGLSNQDGENHTKALNSILVWLRGYLVDGELLAVGHRVVHGGVKYVEAVIVDANVLADLESLVPLAPLHQPHNLEAIKVLQSAMPALPQVACFDTAFHHTQPKVAQQFALPYHYYDEGVRRYGFHGLSYEYIASVLPKLDPKLANANVIVAHLGNGASLCALKDGKSIATTMGFSPLDGLVMGTRCGNLDPGVLLYLMAHEGMTYLDLELLLYHQSGLLGVSGLSGDMRTLLASEDERAQEAVALFVYRVCREIGSLAAALGGLDALVFTGGIGEHSISIREKVCNQLTWYGLTLDNPANRAAATRISTTNSRVLAWVVPTDENWVIAEHTLNRIA